MNVEAYLALKFCFTLIVLIVAIIIWIVNR